MAFQSAQQQSNNSATNRADDSWKADAFLNITVPTKNGKRRRLASVPLKMSRPKEAALIERLKANPNDVHALKEVLELDFHMAEGEEEAQFDF